jgi:hypothetical protein
VDNRGTEGWFGVGSFGSLGLAEIAWLLFIAVAGGLILRKLNEQCKSASVRSRQCPHCKQRTPDIGIFCPICGQKVA